MSGVTNQFNPYQKQTLEDLNSKFEKMTLADLDSLDREVLCRYFVQLRKVGIFGKLNILVPEYYDDSLKSETFSIMNQYFQSLEERTDKIVEKSLFNSSFNDCQIYHFIRMLKSMEKIEGLKKMIEFEKSLIPRITSIIQNPKMQSKINEISQDALEKHKKNASNIQREHAQKFSKVHQELLQKNPPKPEHEHVPSKDFPKGTLNKGEMFLI